MAKVEFVMNETTFGQCMVALSLSLTRILKCGKLLETFLRDKMCVCVPFCFNSSIVI